LNPEKIRCLTPLHELKTIFRSAFHVNVNLPVHLPHPLSGKVARFYHDPATAVFKAQGPVLEMKCSLCGSSKIHASRFRRTDLVHLTSLRYPVRCRACLERRHVNLFRLFVLRQLEKRRRRGESSPEKNGQSTGG
jgi:hypothetical protein